MILHAEEVLNDLDLLIKSKHLLNHDFYKAWSKGELSQECLKEYAKEYYHHVKAFPTYLSAVHCHTECSETRKSLLKNLIEEEGGSPNHPELWRQFAIALGASENELASHCPNAEISHLIKTFRNICSQHSVAEGIAALYAYESQIPEICISKIAGLKSFYGMKNPQDWEYFRVHIAADKEHAAEERELLKGHISKANARSVRDSANAVLDSLWNFLSGLCHRYNIACSLS